MTGFQGITTGFQSKGGRMRRYDGNQFWPTAAQSQMLDRAARTLQGINRATAQVLRELARSPRHASEHAPLCDRLESFASSMNSILTMRELLIASCTEEKHHEFVVRIAVECERHPPANEQKEPNVAEQNLVSDSWREEVESLLSLINRVIERLLGRLSPINYSK